MSHNYYPYPIQPYPAQQDQAYQQELNLLLDAAKAGAVVGATGAAAANLHRMQQGEIEWQQAMSNTVKTGFSAGVATVAATAVGRMLGRNPMLSLAATLATGTAVMYALNRSQQETTDE